MKITIYGDGFPDFDQKIDCKPYSDEDEFAQQNVKSLYESQVIMRAK